MRRMEELHASGFFLLKAEVGEASPGWDEVLALFKLGRVTS
jgi:hypothetical protein